MRNTARVNRNGAMQPIASPSRTRKAASGRESELSREQRVVPDFGMAVERQVIGIERAVTAHEGGDPFVNAGRPMDAACPNTFRDAQQYVI